MEYAAVIIPTLNRVKHLKRCVDSLLNNREASLTDIYISVDYPPSDKYKNGYSEVLDYVKSIKGFSSVNIYYQEKNLGPGLNRKFLEGKVAEKHDKYVFTDDDNEFSNNFLAYMNWGLEKYKDDETIYAVCSCTDFQVKKSNNKEDFFIIYTYNPYGSGHWLHKNIKCAAYLKQRSLDALYKSKDMQEKLLRCFPMVYMWVSQDSIRRVSPMRGGNDNLTYIDIWENMYIILNDLKCIKPIIPKSRNWGLDGSGIHANKGEAADYFPDTELDDLDWPDNPIEAGPETQIKNEEAHHLKFNISEKETKNSQKLFRLNAFLGNRLVYSVYKTMRSIYRFLKKKKTANTEVMYG